MVRPGNAVQTFQPILPYRQQGSPFIKLMGDEFCGTAESSLYLLEGLTSAIGGTTLTNNATVTFALDKDYGNIVGNFVSASSQYLSLPTEASVQVGTGSFIYSAWFKTNTPTAFQVVAMYGSRVGGKQFIELGFDATNFYSAIGDGTNSAGTAGDRATQFFDNQWHSMIVVVDRSSNNIYNIIDGRLLSVTSCSAVTLTLNASGESFYLGARKNGSAAIADFWNGSLANFHLIKAADYNAIGVLNTGIREPVFNGTALSQTANSGTRFNNLFDESGGASGNYIYCLINVEAGEYEIQQVYQTSSDRGIIQLQVDGKTISSVDSYSSGATNNLVTKTYRVPLTEGQHLVKILSNTKNASSTNYFAVHQFINFIKRKGHEEGGVDNFLLLGDEINERANNTWSISNGTSYYYDNTMSNSNHANGDYTEGTLYIKGGLYRIDFNYYKGNDQAMIDLWFGNTQVLNQLDAYSASPSNTNTSTVYVRLQQGRQDIRLAANGKNGSSSTYYVSPQAIRGVRLSD